MRHHVLHDPGERHSPVHEVVLMGAVAVALPIGVVLVDDDVVAGGQHLQCSLHRPRQDALPGLVVQDAFPSIPAFGRRELGVGMVDVVPSAVGQHRVHQMRLDLGCHCALAGETARVTARRFVLEVPLHFALLLGDVGVDQQ